MNASVYDSLQLVCWLCGIPAAMLACMYSAPAIAAERPQFHLATGLWLLTVYFAVNIVLTALAYVWMRGLSWLRDGDRGASGRISGVRLADSLLRTFGAGSELMYPLATLAYVVTAGLTLIARVFGAFARSDGDSGAWAATSCVVLSTASLTAVVPALSIAASRFARKLQTLRCVRVSRLKSLRALSKTDAVIVDSSFLERPDAVAQIDACVAASVKVYLTDSADGVGTDKYVKQKGFTEHGSTEPPLIVKLGLVLEARQVSDHACKGVYPMLGQSKTAVVSGVVKEDDVLQLVSLLQLDYGRTVSVLVSDKRYCACTAAVAGAVLNYDNTDVASAVESDAAAVMIDGTDLYTLLGHMLVVRNFQDNIWKVVGYAVSMCLLLSAPPLLSVATGLPLLLPPFRALVATLLVALGTCSLALEGPEADLMSVSYEKLFGMVPENMKGGEAVVFGRWTSYALQTGMLGMLAIWFATSHTLADTGCGSILQTVFGTCDVSAAAQQTIVTNEVIETDEGRTFKQSELVWEGSIFDASATVLFVVLLAMISWSLLVHRTRRVPTINNVLAPSNLSFRLPPTIVTCVVLFTATILCFTHPWMKSVLDTVYIVPMYGCYCFPMVAFLVVDGELRKFSVLSNYVVFSRKGFLATYQ